MRRVQLLQCGWGILGALLLSLAQCGRSRDNSPLVARVADRTITQQQFALRCELAVRPQLNGTPEEQKRALLELLIDEKLLALEAEDQGLCRDERFKEAVALCADLAAARALYAREVQDKVRLTPQEVAAAAQQMRQTRTVQFFLSKNLEEAEEARRQLVASGSFTGLLRKLGPISADTTRFRFATRWGDIEPALDDAIFQLRIGEISPVVKTTRGYVVFRVDSIAFESALTETEAAELHHRAGKVLRAQREALRADAYVKEVMRDKQVEVDERAFNLLAGAVQRHVGCAGGTLPPLAERQVQLSDELVGLAAQELAGAADMVVLRFAGGQWCIGEVLKRWRVLRPPIATSSPNACRSSLARVLSTMVRDHFLAKEAKRKGLYKSPQVREEIAMWRDHFLAELMLRQLRTNSDPGFSLRRHLQHLRGRYAVERNLQPLQSVALTRIPLVAVRPGQYGALAVPPWPILDEAKQ